MADDWTPGATRFGVGQALSRVEDARLVTGSGRYMDDIEAPNMLHAVVLRAPHAHAILRSIDISEAAAAPGVAAIFTHHDLAPLGLQPFGNCAPTGSGAGGVAPAPVLAHHVAAGRVRYVGEPVAFIVAETRNAARDAAEMIDVDYEPLPAAADPGGALDPDAPQLHDEAAGNVAYRWRTGDAERASKAFDAAAMVVSARVVNQRLAPVSLEPRGVLAEYDAETERWRIHCGTQGSHAMRARLSEHLGVPAERIRVITPDVGGGFGMKLMVHPEYALAAAAARRLARPVKWIADRSESFLSDVHARDARTEGEAAFDGSGRILAMRMRTVSGVGAYISQYGAAIHSIFSAPLLGGLYKTPVIDCETIGAFYNATPSDAYRGAGRPEVAYVTERLLDAGARALGMDPFEIRRRNLVSARDMPFETAGGFTFDSGDPARLFAEMEAEERAGAEARRAEALAAGRGYGIAAAPYFERTGGGPNEAARLRVRPDGHVEAWIGTQSTGQGHETAWVQLIHDKLGVSPDQIHFLPGDSDLLPVGGGTGGARSLIMAHRVFFQAADDVIRRGLAAAAAALEAAEGDIVFSHAEGGRFHVAGTDRSVSLFEAAAHAEDPFGAKALYGEGAVDSRTATFPNGVHWVEAELDCATGALRLARYRIRDDFGRILNPLLATGQVQGGVAQGVGQALLEAITLDPETGQPLAASFMDYAMPRAEDMPALVSGFDESAPCQTNPLGVKGCGEAGSVGSISAVSLAARDALRSVGLSEGAIDAVEPPYSPRRMWEALTAAGKSAL